MSKTLFRHKFCYLTLDSTQRREEAKAQRSKYDVWIPISRQKWPNNLILRAFALNLAQDSKIGGENMASKHLSSRNGRLMGNSMRVRARARQINLPFSYL